MKVRLYIERVQLLNTYLKEFPPFNANQALPNDAVVEIAYHGLPRSWKDFLLMQGFDEQEGNVATLLEISQCIETMEEWSKTKKSVSGKRDCSVSEKLDKTSNKRQKADYFCEYHDLIDPTVLRIAPASLSYNLSVSFVMRNTVQASQLPILVLVVTSRNL
jgi:hypothetical protein